ncbi:response regulator transcription factor [Cellulomonas sp. ACRRI]|uniref:response regulator n=1 Tax=Cellulomonas sp. ACRRI TaxID=2918188 RepID=UPI001EF372B6|nr:response regulator transcription factor [Cellulomonas sp. ACRRI]MCG7286861.1 response regulator transcription factor [Cellulomonas sp. ACRRI]
MTEPDGVRVLLVDDEELVRTGLRLVLGGDPGIVVVGEAGDGRRALDLVRALDPDVVLMDIRMPQMDGLEALRRLRTAPASGPRRPAVVVLTTFDTDDMVLTALRDGADGFLLKNTAPPDLVAAVRAVAAGRPMLSPSVTEQLIAAVARRPDSALVADARARLATLTEREAEVAAAVARGLSNADIATELYMSVGTVKTHVGHLFDKLGVDNRVQVALLVRDAEG